MSKQILLPLLIILLSCSGGVKKEADTETAVTEDTVNLDAFETYYQLASYLTDEPSDTRQIQLIDSSCAIVIRPTVSQMDSMSVEYGDEFESIVDDAFYYQGLAVSLLDSLQIKRTEPKDVLFLKLKGASKTHVLSIRRKGLPEWNIIFFNRDKDPEIISAIDLTADKAKSYFSTAQ